MKKPENDLLDERRRNDLARTAPRGKAVEHNEALLAQGIVKLLLAAQPKSVSAGRRTTQRYGGATYVTRLWTPFFSLVIVKFLLARGGIGLLRRVRIRLKVRVGGGKGAVVADGNARALLFAVRDMVAVSRGALRRRRLGDI